MNARLITQIEEHFCDIINSNEASAAHLEKKQTHTIQKMNSISKDLQDIKIQIHELGFSLLEFIAWLCFTLGIILISIALLVW